jgi:formiminoglutamase
MSNFQGEKSIDGTNMILIGHFPKGILNRVAIGARDGMRTNPERTMTDPYPFLITVPHAGTEVPHEVADRIALTREDLRYFSDPSADDIYDFGDRIASCLGVPISRMVVDVNRSPFDLPPRRADGVIKSRTNDGRPVYRNGAEPSVTMIHRLMMRYYFPFHECIDHLLDEHTIRMAFDCHTMLDRGPPSSPDPGLVRPLICLGNHGDGDGNPLPHRLATCPAQWIRLLADEFSRAFPEGRVAINDPFGGGFTSIAHYWHRGIPFVQVEANRCLYEDHDGTVVSERVHETRERIWLALSRFWARV